MSTTISISISPGTSQSFSDPGDPAKDGSGNDGAVYEKARAWLKSQHAEVMQKQAALRTAKRSQAAAAAKAGAASTTLTPEPIVAKAKGGGA